MFVPNENTHSFQIYIWIVKHWLCIRQWRKSQHSPKEKSPQAKSASQTARELRINNKRLVKDSYLLGNVKHPFQIQKNTKVSIFNWLEMNGAKMTTDQMYCAMQSKPQRRYLLGVQSTVTQKRWSYLKFLFFSALLWFMRWSCRVPSGVHTVSFLRDTALLHKHCVQ